MIGTFVVLILIGIAVGWIYKMVVSASGPRTRVCIAFSVTGSIAGGLIFIFAGLGGELVIGLLTSILVMISADVLSREITHD